MSDGTAVVSATVGEIESEESICKGVTEAPISDGNKSSISKPSGEEVGGGAVVNTNSDDHQSNANDSSTITKGETVAVKPVTSSEEGKMPDSVSPSDTTSADEVVTVGCSPTSDQSELSAHPKEGSTTEKNTTPAQGPEISNSSSPPAASDTSTSASSISSTQPTQGQASESLTSSPATIGSDNQPTETVSDTPATTSSSGETNGAAAQPSEPIPNSEYNLRVNIDCAKTETSSNSPSAGCSQAAAESDSPQQSVYHVKWIRFRGNLLPIITQNENGPCPLLAIMNVLLLQTKVKMPAMMEMVTSDQLMEYLGDCIFENAPKNITEDAQLNYEQNMHDAMAVFHKLQTGLDVNVKFSSVSDFEYTPECIVFDLLGIRLYHGWLVDPESTAEVSAIGQCSYNQLVEKIIMDKNSNKEEVLTEALIAEEFINRTAAQLTYHGLLELATTVKDGQLCVFFRNNHFSTLYKHKDELFLLVTDQGFLTEPNVVWETLSNVEGDGHFVDGEFHTYRKPEPSTHVIPTPAVAVGSDQQVDQDYLVALSMQQEQQMAEQVAVAGAPPPPAAVATEWTAPPAQHLSDHELAMRLQEEENRRAQQVAPQDQRSNNQSNGANRERKKSNDCIIL